VFGGEDRVALVLSALGIGDDHGAASSQSVEHI
jgi:hypothetical protein